MNKKLIGICVCILFFGASVCPSIAGYEKVIDKKEINDYNNLIKYAIESGVLSNNVWIEQYKLLASDGATDDYFGISVSIDGDYALIGAYYDDTAKGSAYVFKRDGTIWTEEQKLTASDGAIGDGFGWSVSIDGEYALIGAYGDDAIKGSAYVFTSENQPPNNPTISGPTTGKPNTEYDFTLNSVDSDGDDVRFHIDWNDGDSETSSFTSSGSNMVVSHIWTGQGTYTITVYAEDEFGAVSGTTTSQMIIEKSKTMSNPFLHFLQQYPILYQLLKKFLRL